MIKALTFSDPSSYGMPPDNHLCPNISRALGLLAGSIVRQHLMKLLAVSETSSQYFTGSNSKSPATIASNSFFSLSHSFPSSPGPKFLSNGV